MNDTKGKLRALYDRIPRRHTADNIKEAHCVLDAYEHLLTELESYDRYENQIAPFFEAIAPIRITFKKSNDPKASKKSKDVLFDEASGALKDSIDELVSLV